MEYISCNDKRFWADSDAKTIQRRHHHSRRRLLIAETHRPMGGAFYMIYKIEKIVYNVCNVFGFFLSNK